MTFTTRPEIKGTFGAVASTHWIASAVGMKLLEAGGTAVDSAAGTAFVLNVVEPHLNGPLGDMTAMHWQAGAPAPVVYCGQGPAPAGATIEHYRAEGLTLIPGSGLLAATVPGVFGAWCALLHDHGRLTLREVLEPALHYAEHGHPLLPRVAATIADQAEFFRKEWPSSASVWLPGDVAPGAGALFRNPDLAAFWRRLLKEADAKSGREAQIEAARMAFYQGFVAEAIDAQIAAGPLMDGTGQRRSGVLRGDDMAGWTASTEPAAQVAYQGWDVWKAGPWTQGPVLLQSLKIAEALGFADAAKDDLAFVHLVTEILKRAFADREAYYGDPKGATIPMDVLLSADHATAHAAEISDVASTNYRAGDIPGFDHQIEAALRRAQSGSRVEAGIGGGEPTMAHLAPKEGDTVHIDVVDQWGNMVSATPSGGWLQSNPVVPGIGVPLGTRAQMFWLEPDLPTSLAPGRRPRTTLSPSFARDPSGRRIAFGTPGGDQQDQWQLMFLLRLIHCGLDMQQAIDQPLFMTNHMRGSFYPRDTQPGHLLIEPSFSDAVQKGLRDKGHALEIAEPWAIGRLTAAAHRADGVVEAAATPRLMQAYAIGR